MREVRLTVLKIWSLYINVHLSSFKTDIFSRTVTWRISRSVSQKINRWKWRTWKSQPEIWALKWAFDTSCTVYSTVELWNNLSQKVRTYLLRYRKWVGREYKDGLFKNFTTYCTQQYEQPLLKYIMKENADLS